MYSRFTTQQKRASPVLTAVLGFDYCAPPINRIEVINDQDTPRGGGQVAQRAIRCTWTWVDVVSDVKADAQQLQPVEGHSTEDIPP